MNEQSTENMLSVVPNTLCSKVREKYIPKMPRVVTDQRGKFENDELFRKLSRECEVRYTGFRDRPQEERQLRFQTECREGHADIAFVGTGTNLQLSFATNAWSDKPEDRVPTQEYVNFDMDRGKVHLKSQFIMNGVCVVWRGWVDLHRLDGVGSLQFDEDRAEVEDQMLREQIEQYQRRLHDFDDRQRQYQQEQRDRQAESEAEGYLKHLRPSELTDAKIQSLSNSSELARPVGFLSKRVLDGEKFISKTDKEVQMSAPQKPVRVNDKYLPWKKRMYIL